MVPTKMPAPTMTAPEPCRATATSRNGAAISAAARPTPWLTLLAISSPRDCARSRTATRLFMTTSLCGLTHLTFCAAYGPKVASIKGRNNQHEHERDETRESEPSRDNGFIRAENVPGRLVGKWAKVRQPAERHAASGENRPEPVPDLALRVEVQPQSNNGIDHHADDDERHGFRSNRPAQIAPHDMIGAVA